MTRLSWHQQRAAGFHALPHDVVGYVWHASTYCPDDTIRRMIGAGEASPAALAMPAEDALDQIAAANAIDRGDESSFDSDEFPKVILRDCAEDATCEDCGVTLDAALSIEQQLRLAELETEGHLRASYPGESYGEIADRDPADYLDPEDAQELRDLRATLGGESA